MFQIQKRIIALTIIALSGSTSIVLRTSCNHSRLHKFSSVSITSRTALRVLSSSQHEKCYDVVSRKIETISVGLDDSLTEQLQTNEEILLDSVKKKKNGQTTAPFSQDISEGTKKASSVGSIDSIRSGFQDTTTPSTVFFGKWSVAASIFTIIIMSITMQQKYVALTRHLFSATFWGSLSPVFSIGMKIAPISTMKRILKEDGVGGLPLLPYSSMFTLTVVLLIYGILINDKTLIYTHVTGSILASIYCSIFLKNCPNSCTTLPGTPQNHKSASAAVVFSVLSSAAIFGARTGAQVAGYASVFLCSMMYFGPLTAMKRSVEQKSSRDIPLPFAVLSFINALCWTAYSGFVRKDMFILVPCVLGMFSSVTQIILNLIY